MSDFRIERSNLVMVDKPGLEWVRQFLFRCYRGESTDDNRAWKLMWRKIFAMKGDDVLTVSFVFERHLPTHKGYFKFEAELFDKQEQFDNRDVFREYLKVGAGFVVWVPGADGGIVPIPKRLNFRAADELTFRRYVADAIAFIRGEHLQAFLWPHLEPAERSQMVEQLLKQYERFMARFE